MGSQSDTKVTQHFPEIIPAVSLWLVWPLLEIRIRTLFKEADVKTDQQIELCLLCSDTSELPRSAEGLPCLHVLP